MIEQMAALSFNQSNAGRGDDKDAVRLNRLPHLPPTDFHRRPHLPPTDSDAPTMVAMADRDEGVDEVMAAAHPHSMQDVHPPSHLSRRGGHQGTWDHLQPQAEDIMRRRPRHSKFRPHRTRTS